MKLILALLLALPVTVSAQTLVLPADSTTVTFPNQVRLSLTRNVVGTRTYFQLERKAFKALLLTTNYYLQQNAISLDNVDILLRNQPLMDSTLKIMDSKYKLELDRTNLYKTAYEDLKQVSATYDKQLLQCASDLETLKKQKDRSKTISFIKGFLWGTGLLGGIFAVAAMD